MLCFQVFLIKNKVQIFRERYTSDNMQVIKENIRYASMEEIMAKVPNENAEVSREKKSRD